MDDDERIRIRAPLLAACIVVVWMVATPGLALLSVATAVPTGPLGDTGRTPDAAEIARARVDEAGAELTSALAPHPSGADTRGGRFDGEAAASEIDRVHRADAALESAERMLERSSARRGAESSAAR